MIQNKATVSEATEEQKDFIQANPKMSYILKATAGSGKTKSTIDRIKFLISQGVPEEKIAMFSYTTAAVNEFKERLQNDKVKVTTIHAFCLGMLSRMKKFKEVIDIYDFLKWYVEKNKPKSGSSQQVRDDFYELTQELYDSANYIDSEFGAYKLQQASGIKSRIPEYYFDYVQFLKETKSRDFSDMLIEVRELLKDNKWLNLFKNKYDYILVDEFQDTSLIQLEILLKLNAKYYTLIGDVSQSIYLYSGANAHAIMDLLKSRRECVEMSLSINFRSKKVIVEHANQYSELQAKPFHSEDGGLVHKNLLIFEDLVELLKTRKEVVILARTNKLIKQIEKRLLQRKFPMRYFNYLTDKEIESLRKAEERHSTKMKVRELLPVFKTAGGIIDFIEENKDKKSFVTSIHKSKGREFPVCVIVNCVSPEILTFNKIQNLSKEQYESLSFYENDESDENIEARNVFYVAVTRPKEELFFMIMGI